MTSVVYFEQEWVREFVWKCGFKLSASAKFEYVGRLGREGLSRYSETGRVRLVGQEGIEGG